ncbi:MAG: guanylate kinase [bacterium]|nr:guanylate kinase [bacterium]
MTQIGVNQLDKLNSRKPLIVVMSGPSGVGKSSIVEGLLTSHRDFVESVSATTRKRRTGERSGRDYFFLSHAEFRNKKKNREFIETAEIFGEFYGTPKKPVLDALERKRTVLFDIDIAGGQAIKKWCRDAVLIFIMPPSLNVLRKRLVGRKTESESQVKVRLGRALKEMKVWTKYDYVVCNDDLERATALIENIITAESQRVSRSGTINFTE